VLSVTAVVFMGSKKFPKPNEWDVFVKSNGGNSNARTDLEAVRFHVLFIPCVVTSHLDTCSFLSDYIAHENFASGMKNSRILIRTSCCLAIPVLTFSVGVA